MLVIYYQHSDFIDETRGGRKNIGRDERNKCNGEFHREW